MQIMCLAAAIREAVTFVPNPAIQYFPDVYGQCPPARWREAVSMTGGAGSSTTLKILRPRRNQDNLPLGTVGGGGLSLDYMAVPSSARKGGEYVVAFSSGGVVGMGVPEAWREGREYTMQQGTLFGIGECTVVLLRNGTICFGCIESVPEFGVGGYRVSRFRPSTSCESNCLY